jgi:Glycosyl transferases group 1
MERAVQRAMERAGHTTLLFDDRRSARRLGFRLTQFRARRLARRFRPDFVFLSKCLRLHEDTVGEILRDRPNAMWYHDPQWHADLDHPEIAHIASVGRMAETFFVTGFVAEWKALGLPAAFLPAAGAREIVPGRPDPANASTVAFIGAGYDPTRADFLRVLSRAVPTRVYGPGWDAWREELAWSGGPVEGAAFATACASAEYSLGILPARAGGATTYASDRMWMVILAGGLYLGPDAPGIRGLLQDGEHCFWYRDVDDCIQRIRVLESDPALRARVRQQGEAFVRAHHTYDARVPFLLERREWQNPLG